MKDTPSFLFRQKSDFAKNTQCTFCCANKNLIKMSEKRGFYVHIILEMKKRVCNIHYRIATQHASYRFSSPRRVCFPNWRTKTGKYNYVMRVSNLHVCVLQYFIKPWFFCYAYFWGLPFYTTHGNWFNFFRSNWVWRHIFASQKVGTVVCCWLWRGRSSSSHVYTLAAERKETGNEQGWAFFYVELENERIDLYERIKRWN